MPATVGERRRVTPDQSTELRLGRGTLVRLGIVAVAVLAAIWAVGRYGRHYTFFDLKIYHGAMVWWTHGGNLYDFVSPGTTLGFTYPPFAALAMAPMAVLPTIVAGWLNTLVSLAALTLLLAWLLVPVADRYSWPRWFPVALAVPPAAPPQPGRATPRLRPGNPVLAGPIYGHLLV